MNQDKPAKLAIFEENPEGKAPDLNALYVKLVELEADIRKRLGKPQPVDGHVVEFSIKKDFYVIKSTLNDVNHEEIIKLLPQNI